MTVTCPQCGAPLAAQTESRFYRCPFCTSSFAFHDGAGIERFYFPCARDDRQAWSAISEWLTDNGRQQDFVAGSIDFRFFPFWRFILPTGAQRLVSAVDPPNPFFASITLPPGDLSYLSDDGEFAAPTVTIEAARHLLPAGIIPQRQSLVYIPLAIASFQSGQQSCQAVVSPLANTVYGIIPGQVAAIALPLRHVAMIAFLGLLLSAEGVAVKNIAARGGVFLATAICLFLIYRFLLAKEL